MGGGRCMRRMVTLELTVLATLGAFAAGACALLGTRSLRAASCNTDAFWSVSRGRFPMCT